MTLRIAKKILKNKEQLNYGKVQMTKAETIVRRYEKNKKADA